MGFLPKNPFANKPVDSSSEQAPSVPLSVAVAKPVLPPHPEPDFTPKARPVRDANGKFISKKKPIAAPIPAVDQISTPHPDNTLEPKPSAPQDISEDTTKPVATSDIDRRRQDPQTVTFYGFEVRKFYEDDWYFSILDILALARVILPAQYLHTIKQKPEAEAILNESTKIFSYAKDPETIERVESITYDGFMKILPIMRSQQTIFPGPFPDWLHNMSTIQPEMN